MRHNHYGDETKGGRYRYKMKSRKWLRLMRRQKARERLAAARAASRTYDSGPDADPPTERQPAVPVVGRDVMRSAAFGLAGSMLGTSLARSLGGSRLMELGLGLMGSALGRAVAGKAGVIELEFVSQFVELERDLEVMPGVLMPAGSVGAVLHEQGGEFCVMWPDLGPPTMVSPRFLRPSSSEEWERVGGRS